MKNILFVFCLFLFQSLYSQPGTYTISGKISGLDTEKMSMVYKNEKGETVRKEITVKAGSFSYTEEIKEMTMITIWPNVDRTVKKTGNGYFPAKSSQLQFVAFPEANVRFSGKITDFVEAYPSGDPANNELSKLNRKIFPLMNESINLSVKIANKVITDSGEINKARQKGRKLDEEVKQIKLDFIKNNPSSTISAWTLGDMMLRSQISNETAINLFDKFQHDKLLNESFYEEVSTRVAGIRATVIGNIAPEINSNHTYDNKPFKLSSLQGKYVVLDFWGTWCAPCISGMPRMKEYLNKYSDKMEIVGIAQESDDGTKWRDFLNKNQNYQWHHVLSRNDVDYILKYNVAGFPTKIIIDPEGKIVSRYVGEDDAIYDKLDKLFK